MNKTIEYYNENAKSYFNNTVNADMTEHYERFLKYLPKGSYILDVGCGSGRDSKYFLSLGYHVKAIDGSIQMCELASKYIGQTVENIIFNEISYENEFNGIWACASLLHADKGDLKTIINQLKKALKEHGIMYVSFKYGDSDRIQSERYFNDQNEESIKKLLKDFIIKELWLSDDVRPGRNDRWINVVAEKNDIDSEEQI